MLYLGCHLSAGGGNVEMVKTAQTIGANTFAFFTRNPRGSRAKPEDPEDCALAVKQLKDNAFGPLVAHGAYTMNVCTADKEARAFAADVLADDLRAFTDKVEASFLLDRLDYMVKGGRCSAAAALGANLLNLKPCIEVKNGKMGVVKKYRGNYAKCLSNYVKDRLSGREDLDKGTLFVTRTPITEECMQAVKDTVAQYDDFETTYWSEAGCTVSCHCGPGTLGVLFVRK